MNNKSFNCKSSLSYTRNKSDDVLNHILAEMRDIKTCMSSRLTSLELKVSLLVETCNKISQKIEDIGDQSFKAHRCVDDDLTAENVLIGEFPDETSMSKGFQVIPLSSESDYPNGSWLGNPKSMTERVRCGISQQKLFLIHSMCMTPEKMALSLLDNLFSKEELSISNISGRSRCGKKQLNPLLIYGIRVHLKYKFGLSDKDWLKICQNIDAKCRWVHKRVKRVNNSVPAKVVKVHNKQRKPKEKLVNGSSSNEGINFDFEHLSHSNMDFGSCVKVTSQPAYEIRMLNSASQIGHIDQNEEIILAGELDTDANESKLLLEDVNKVSMSDVNMDEVDTLTITHEESLDGHEKTDRNSHCESEITPVSSLTIPGSQLVESLHLEVSLGHEVEVDDVDSSL